VTKAYLGNQWKFAMHSDERGDFPTLVSGTK